MRRHLIKLLSFGIAITSQVMANSPDAVVTFQEIHYNPPLTQDAEWIELHNQMAVNIDISGWKFTNGVEYTFPQGTIINAGANLIIAKLPAHSSWSGFSGVLGPYTGLLSNSGETIELRNSSNRLMDRISYGDSGSWPLAADGLGATLAKRRPGLASEPAENWRASIEMGGTPQQSNFLYSNDPIVVEHIIANQSWKYRDTVVAPPSDWMNAAFNDAIWTSGTGAFGSAATIPVLSVTASLTSRYRAGAITGLVDNTIVTSWTDTHTSDGSSQNLINTDDPRFETNSTLTGEPTVSFDGNDAMRATLTPNITPTSGFVYFIVCKASAVITNGSITGGDGAYICDRVATVDAPLVSLKAVNGRFGFQKRYDNSSGLGGPVSSTSISTSQYQIVTLRRNLSAARFEIWVDGVMESSETDTGENLTPQPIVLGNHASLGATGYAGDVAEMLIYKNELSTSDFQAVGSYLESKYGLTTAFPNSTVNTTIAASASTSYLRKSFTFSGNPARTNLKLRHTLSDGGVFYLNGQEISRSNLAAGTITHTTNALSDLTVPQNSNDITVPATALVQGTNVLAVSLHTGATDNTCYFDATLTSYETPEDPDAAPAFRLNEIAADSSSSFYIELINPNNTPSSTAGYGIEVQGLTTNTFLLPSTTVAAGSLIHYTTAQLGFSVIDGDKVVIKRPDGTIADARTIDNELRGLSDAWPDQWLRPSSETPSSANTFQLQNDIVINEICYRPAEVSLASNSKQWIELYHRGNTAIDLGSWSFTNGIAYTFPPNTIMLPDSYLLVAHTPGNFTAAAGATVLGPWSGSLAGEGETITLTDAVGNPADEVQYLDGGRWTDLADGAGSSLELRDAHANNQSPESWSASQESSKRNWQTYTYRMTAAASSVGPDSQWREFIFGLLDRGDVLIDDISVIENPDGAATQMLANGNFQNGTTGWRFLGNHRHASIVNDPTNASNQVLFLSSLGATEHMHNHVETTLAAGRSITNGLVYEISYRARWLNGSNRLNTRLYFNRCAKTNELARSDDPGTPGAANSTAQNNIGPSFANLTHSPTVPSANEAVTITAQASDPDGMATLTLFYSVNGGSFSSVAMNLISAGIYEAEIPAQAASSVVRFSALYPAAGAQSYALYQVNDGLAATNGLHNLRIIMPPAEEALLYQLNNLMSNERLGCTVIYNEKEVYYNVGVRLKSSQRGRPATARVGFNLGFYAGQLFRGVHKTVSIDRSEGQITGAQEILYDHMMYAGGGIPAEYNDLCKVIAPDPAHTSTAIMQLARFGDVFLDSQFDNGSNGTAYEYELIYYPTTVDGSGFKLPTPDSVVGTDVVSLGADKENYRWNYLLENNEDVDDYTRIIALGQHFSKTGTAFATGLEDVIDVDQWLSALAFSCASGAGDSFFSNANHNGIFYARPDGRVLYFPHDLDFSYSATRSIFENSELNKIIAQPRYRRSYLGKLHDICTTVFNQNYMSPWASHYGSLLPSESFSSHLSYINTRSNYILNAINTDIPTTSFAITTNGGSNFSSAVSPVTLAGQGWVDVKDIRIVGSSVPLNVTWTSNNAWQLAVPLGAGANLISLEAVNYSGQIIGNDSITVNNTGGIVLPSASNLVVSEIYYNPSGAIETTEYVELTNISSNTLDMSNVSFTLGITYTTPGGALLGPGSKLVIAKDLTAFATTFGSGINVVGPFLGQLDNGGEIIEMRRADGSLLLSFSYDDAIPWPTIADGDGYSLELVSPFSLPNLSDPLSWRASVANNGGSPGIDGAITYAAWKLANGNHAADQDLDGDGLSTMLEYYLGGNPQMAEQSLHPTFLKEPAGTFLMSITRNVNAQQAEVIPEGASNLINWSNANYTLISNDRLTSPAGVDRLTFRITPPPNSPRYFGRFRFGM
ncbi:MAG: hypothetical protein CAK88_13330 [Verrucomicrobiia bacterium AMD-G2]|nr:MAG: hypothetical protein CAK88_13330 [Verrucomicrobiae bacterium AMD-G2]